MKHAYLGDVAGVVADDDILADIGRERRVHVAKALKIYAVATNEAGLGDRQQQ